MRIASTCEDSTRRADYLSALAYWREVSDDRSDTITSKQSVYKVDSLITARGKALRRHP